MNDLFHWLTLKAISGLGERSIKKLYQYYKDPKLILEADEEELSSLVGQLKAKAIKEKNLSFDPEEVIKIAVKEGIKYTTLSDKDYPLKLKEIEDPPSVLFYRGELRQVNFFGVVGTRNPDSYSVKYAKELVSFLVGKGYGIASGCARGIDALCHKSCIESGGYTVCILGMGILNVREEVQNFILKSGAIISEFLPWERGDKHTFPRRNRLISGLSDGLFVVEAGEKSGALITAYYAKEQGRPVYTHVGYGSSERWEGCIKLVNEGIAKLVGRLERFDVKGEKVEDPILIALSTPKTLTQLSQILEMDEKELNRKLTVYEINGYVYRNGPYYCKLKQEWEEYECHEEFFPSSEEI